MDDISELLAPLRRDGFAFAPAAAMRALLQAAGSLAGWEAFAASWNDLKTDEYVADPSKPGGGRYRKRRYAVYAANANGIKREAHQAHFQSLDYNPLFGGIDRWFEPVTDAIGESAPMRTILVFCRALFEKLSAEKSPHLTSPSRGEEHCRDRERPDSPPLEGGVGGGVKQKTLLPENWHIEAHQFRIEASAGEKGQPTPEGAHRDERDYVLVLLIRRENIKSGTTTIYDLGKKPLGSFTLTAPFDAALVDDNRVYHGVTPVEPLDPAKPAYRDVLVVTFKLQDQH